LFLELSEEAFGLDDQCKMSEYETPETRSLRTKSSRKSYSPDSTNDLEELMDDRDSSMVIDNNNIIMKTPQSLDDLLDVDANNNNEHDDDDDDENESNDDVEEDSTHLNMDQPKTTTDKARQKKSIEKNGKICALVK
jgi:hypothetical protein